jgi:ribosome-associated toxin RatA of RatAB toxin-antitoxin module
MFISKIFIIFLPFLYFRLAICFHKNIQTSSKKSLYVSNTPDILLPYLYPEDKNRLAAGEIIEKQRRDGSRGFGTVIIDIKYSPDVVFDTLRRFDMYQDMIPIVRTSKIVSSNGPNTIAEYTLSRLSLRINVIHTVLPDQRLIKFTLDPTRLNLVFREAEGFWHVQIPTDRPEGYCRVYLSAQILTHKNVPKIIIDYAATTALSRATTWLKPFFIEKSE